MRFKVYRLSPGQEPRIDTFEFEPVPGMTVLSALFHIQNNLDDSLAFRYSCRGAVCGSCAMLINGVPALACRTQVANRQSPTANRQLQQDESDSPARLEIGDRKSEIVVSPLPNLPVLRDLVVDMTRFFAAYREVQPFLQAAAELPVRENLMDPKKVAELEAYTNCILCACCYGVCPVVAPSLGPESKVQGPSPFLGPAALAKLYRFHIDPRDKPAAPRLGLADKPEGWWACRFHRKCQEVCPRGVPPTIAIGKARAELQRAGSGPDKDATKTRNTRRTE